MMATSPLPIPPPNAEHRRTPRYRMALDVAFGPCSSNAVRPAESKLARTITIDLSLGGLCLYSDVLYPVGTTLFCHLTVPGRTRPIEVTGTLVWFHKVNRGSVGYMLGIEFTEVSPEAQGVLKALFDHPPAAQASNAKRVLLVDDDAELRLALKLRFESSGFQVLTAGDGLEALRKGREERPHLIILDLMLPQLNGYEVCRLLKYDQKFQHIPVILLSARCRQEDENLGREVGADAYVTKPFSGKELIAKVEELLSAAPR